ncbi:30S ribosomal protein S13 [candidate division bacterium WOR-3 4484_18]|uniref:Small ribosomal subunit protein uS13 n=1 Tax=candidate division WOR-3 bacterium 4484_18 TaxID=2020626 RepID=A0A257LV65_UNCW3|nr:MAG: 30S ribosomal protein S13 [candidate division bacterium WOR-3 4484_18]
MARIAGRDLPPNKRIEVALTYIYGIGLSRSRKILEATGVDPDKRVKDLTEKEIELLRKEIEGKYKVEGTLRAEIRDNIKRLIAIRCWRGLRHEAGLPVRGQRTRTNARTRKGPRGAQIGKRKKG